MANYINTLKALVEARDAEIAILRANLNDLRIYLTTSSKFGHGRPATDGDGLPMAEPAERLDWISTSEAVMQIDAITRAADAIRDQVEG